MLCKQNVEYCLLRYKEFFYTFFFWLQVLQNIEIKGKVWVSNMFLIWKKYVVGEDYNNFISTMYVFCTMYQVESEIAFIKVLKKIALRTLVAFQLIFYL